MLRASRSSISARNISATVQSSSTSSLDIMLALAASSIGRRAIAPSARVVVPLGVQLSSQTSPTNRSFSTLKKHLVLNTIGPDRPGIVADITRIVTSNGGNVGESRAQLLGGYFSIMMLVEVADGDVEKMHEELRSVEGMSTGCFEAVDPKMVEMKPQIGFAGHFKLSGADNPGIVHKLTSVLARNSLSIAHMKTRQEEAPFGGTELFTMEGMTVAYKPLASHFDWEKIRDELVELGEDLNCDVEFSDITGSTIRN